MNGKEGMDVRDTAVVSRVWRLAGHGKEMEKE